jgi:hypothetical protein
MLPLDVSLVAAHHGILRYFLRVFETPPDPADLDRFYATHANHYRLKLMTSADTSGGI